MVDGNSGWIVAVNLVIWTGLFAYVLFLDRKVRRLEDDQRETHE